MIEKIFKDKGLKITNSRKQVYDVIKNNKINTIKSIIDKCENINTTTIYRIIDIFLEKDIIDKKISVDNEVYYEIKPTKHSHYISCVKCNKKEKIDDKYIASFEKNISKGYEVIHHDIDFVGICESCRKVCK